MKVCESRGGTWEGSRNVQEGVHPDTHQRLPLSCVGQQEGGGRCCEVIQEVFVKCLMCVTLPDTRDVTANRRDKAPVSRYLQKYLG